MRENSQAWHPSWQTTSATHAESPTEPDRGFGGGLRNKNEAEIEAEIHKYVMNATLCKETCGVVLTAQCSCEKRGCFLKTKKAFVSKKSSSPPSDLSVFIKASFCFHFIGSLLCVQKFPQNQIFKPIFEFGMSITHDLYHILARILDQKKRDPQRAHHSANHLFFNSFLQQN